jgi:hypothetical protein
MGALKGLLFVCNEKGVDLESIVCSFGCAEGVSYFTFRVPFVDYIILLA